MAFEKGVTPQGAKVFQPGQSGNPNGRPKKLPKIDDLLSDILGAEEDRESEAHAILLSLVLEAKSGNVRAAEILLDRAYGKAKQAVDVTSKGESINQINLGLGIPPEK